MDQEKCGVIVMGNLLLGINGLSYSSFMECNPKFLLSLFGATYRGVVLNRDSLHPSPAWLSVLKMKDVTGNSFIAASNDELPLVMDTKSKLVNIPITDPSLGLASMHYSAQVSAEKEIDDVKQMVSELLPDNNVIASINAIDRLMSNGEQNKCHLYELVDSSIRSMTSRADDFIVFSPFGGGVKNGKYVREVHGIYMGTIDRPSEFETIRPANVGALFRELASKK
ncbi:MAG: hypothetical protein LVQ96_02850 [Thermoplasmatales archaeon]|nr:hypothetical protein [Thermoplasmatales archaeon]MCW6170089.1 hypothetical protein [Thermoplasmatales archaeon]